MMLGVKGKRRIIIRRVLYAQDRGTGISGKGIESERALESGKALESDCDTSKLSNPS